MRKTLTALAAAATLTLATVAAPHQAEARGGRVAGAIIGGLAVGALIGAAAANNGYYYYGPRRHYYYRDCYFVRERWWNGYRWRHRRVRVCD